METFSLLHKASKSKNGPKLASLLSITNPDISSLARAANDEQAATSLIRELLPKDPFHPVYVQLWKVALQIVRNQDLVAAYDAQNGLLIALNRLAETTDRWILPPLSTVAKELRQLAILADKATDSAGHLEEATRAINRSFQLCLNDRNSNLDRSRKWGIYFFIGELYKIYFMLHKQALGKNILRALDNVEHLPLTEYPVSHNVTVSYYIGVSYFIEDKFHDADIHLTAAWNLCHSAAKTNQERILMYLIPTRLLKPLWGTPGAESTGYLPSRKLLQKYPRLSVLYGPLLQALNDGNIDVYNRELLVRRSLLIKKYLYLAFERAQLLASRNLLHRAHKILGQASRVPVEDFANALSVAKYFPYKPIDEDDKLNQTEGLVSALISQNLVKGYISHERRTFVLRAENAFVF